MDHEKRKKIYMDAVTRLRSCTDLEALLQFCGELLVLLHEEILLLLVQGSQLSQHVVVLLHHS
jgi:hypothetical protein